MSKKLTDTKKEETPSPTPATTLPAPAATSPAEKTQLSGFNLEEFKAKPMDVNTQRKKQILTIQVGKPNKQNFFRVHPTLQYPVYILDWIEEKTSYLVHPKLVELLENQIKYKILYVAQYSSGTPFLLAVSQPDNSGKWNNWHRSLNKAVEVAKKKWVRIEADQTAQSYNLYYAASNFGEPKWLEMSIDEYIAIAFKDTQILDENHPKVKELQGLV